MENIEIGENKVIVKASDILKKLKSPADRRNFALENIISFFYFLTKNE